MLSTALHRLHLSLLLGLLCLVQFGLGNRITVATSLKGDSHYRVELFTPNPSRPGYFVYSSGYMAGKEPVNWVILKPSTKEMIVLQAFNGEDRPGGKQGLHLNEVMEAMWTEHSGSRDVKTLQRLDFQQLRPLDDTSETTKAIAQARRILQVDKITGFVLYSDNIKYQSTPKAKKQKQVWDLLMKTPFPKAAQRMGPDVAKMKVVAIEVKKSEFEDMDDMLLHIR